MRKESIVLFLLLAGCTERWIQVRSEPPGATVYLDGKRFGTTPCKGRFIWYGDRELVLERDEFQSHTEIVRLRPPWWQWPFLDLIPDFLLPWTFTDLHSFSFSLKKRTFDPKERSGMKERAEQLRRELEKEE